MSAPDRQPQVEGNGQQTTTATEKSKIKLFRRKDGRPQPNNSEKGPSDGPLPMYNEHGHQVNEHGHRVNSQGHRVTPGIQPDGESGRKWFSPLHFFKIIARSSSTASACTNVLWPFTIAALVLYFNYNDHHLWIFITAYIGMVPAANLVGFAGQELARKLPKVFGVILETTFGSIVEIILFMVLLRGEQYPVIRAAILGSILANLLFCLGLCFFVGGLFHENQKFHEAISEVGSNLMLVAGFGLIIPTIYANSLNSAVNEGLVTAEGLLREELKISRAAAIVLLIAFCVYVFFQARSHHGLYEEILETDEMNDHDRHKDLAKAKLTLTESILALLIALMFVSFMAVILVFQIEYIIDRGVSDAFMGLILIPLVEKVAEHLTAVDEAYDNQMNFALSHVLGASIQTALLNTPLVVIVGWGLGLPMSLNFELFDAVVLILAIIVVGNFLRDEKSDYLEGALCVFVYTLIAVCAFFYPNPPHGENGTGTTSEAGAAVAHAVTRLMRP